jgi:hypothetical protein
MVIWVLQLKTVQLQHFSIIQWHSNRTVCCIYDCSHIEQLDSLLELLFLEMVCTAQHQTLET